MNNKANPDKFVWKENENKIARTQCELCKYGEKISKKCVKYTKGIKAEILDNKIKCPEFKSRESRFSF